VDELELIKRCQAGDRDARRQVFEQTSGRIFGVCLRLTGNTDDAAELAQDTYVRGFERLGQFDGRSSLASWFYRIAINEALQFRRRRKLGKAKLQALAAQRTSQAREPTTDLCLDVEQALRRLSTEDQAVLVLRYQEGLDYRGMAKVLECAVGTVASRLNRARDRLRELLRKSYG